MYHDDKKKLAWAWSSDVVGYAVENFATNVTELPLARGRFWWISKIFGGVSGGIAGANAKRAIRTYGGLEKE